MIRLARVPFRALGVLGALTFAACSGAGGTDSAPGPTPPPESACPDIVIARSAPLIAPANGATGVPTTIGSVTVTSEQGLAGLKVLLMPSGGATVGGGSFAAVSSSTMAATVPVLSAHTTYTVTSGSVTTDGNCQIPTVWSIGTFTTQ